MAIKFVAFLLLFAFVSFLSDAATIQTDDNDVPERRCVPGANYFDGCNWCHCHPARLVSCTLKLCQVFNPETGDFEAPKALQPPDSFWEQDQWN